jgi:hypothetical protein
MDIKLVSHIKGRTQIECVSEQGFKRIFGPKRDEMSGGWRRLHNEECHNLYSSSNIIGVIKSRRMRWEGHVALMMAMENLYKILVEKPDNGGGKHP